MLLQKHEKYSEKYQFIVVGDVSQKVHPQNPEKENLSPTKPPRFPEKQYGKPYLKKILKSGAVSKPPGQDSDDDGLGDADPLFGENGPRVEPRPLNVQAQPQPQPQ